MANPNATNIQLGVCSVVRNGVNLGHTIGGVTITYTPTFKRTNVDQTGESTAKIFLVGEEFKAEFSLAEFTLQNIQAAIAQGTAVGDDSTSIGSYAGKNATLTAAEWKFHPIANASTNYNDDITIFKGVSTGELKIEHNNEGEKVLPLTVEAVVDEGRSDGGLLGYIGDSIS